MRGRVVLITGASGGVGRGIALACAADGPVWIAARRRTEGEAVAAEVTAAGGQGRFVPCDAGDGSSVQAAVTRVLDTDGRLDAVVHNATSDLSPKPSVLPDLPLEDLRQHVGVSLRGSWLLARAAYEALRAAGGAFILLTSEAGFEGQPLLSPYAAVKAGQRGLARALAREWGPAGIRVNCIAPLAATPAMERAFLLNPAIAAQLLGRNPLGRLGESDTDIGPVVRFLVSSDARYVTGQTVMVDGGSCPVT